MYFLPIWGLKLFFWMFLEYDISVQLWCCWSNFGTRLQAIKPNVTHVWCLTEMFLASNKGLMPFVRVCFFFVVVVALFSSLKCPYDQIFDIHFFFLHFRTQCVFPGYLAKFQSITQYRASVFWTFIPRELSAAINSWLKIGANNGISSKIPHGLKL